jgi:hypothetical protein
MNTFVIRVIRHSGSTEKGKECTKSVNTCLRNWECGSHCFPSDCFRLKGWNYIGFICSTDRLLLRSAINFDGNGR